MAGKIFREIVAEHESDMNPIRYIRELIQTHRKRFEFMFHGMVASVWVSRDPRSEEPRFKLVFGHPGTGDKVPFGDFESATEIKRVLSRMGRVLGESVSFSDDE